MRNSDGLCEWKASASWTATTAAASHAGSSNWCSQPPTLAQASPANMISENMEVLTHSTKNIQHKNTYKILDTTYWQKPELKQHYLLFRVIPAMSFIWHHIVYIFFWHSFWQTFQAGKRRRGQLQWSLATFSVKISSEFYKVSRGLGGLFLDKDQPKSGKFAHFRGLFPIFRAKKPLQKGHQFWEKPRVLADETCAEAYTEFSSPLPPPHCCIWCSIWHFGFWQSWWPMFCYSFWLSIWHIFWHSTWHSLCLLILIYTLGILFWHSFIMAFYLAYLLTFFLAFYLAYLLMTFFLTFLSGLSSDILIWHIFWHSFLAFYLAYLLTFILAFYLAYLLTFFLAFYLAKEEKQEKEDKGEKTKEQSCYTI